MTLPIVLKPDAVRDAIARLATVQPGDYRVVSSYLKLELRDKTRGKYLIKMKNRVRDTLEALARQPLDRPVREQVAGDLSRVLRYLEEPGRLPAGRGIALFACEPLGLFEVFALPQVHRSRLAVTETPLIQPARRPRDRDRRAAPARVGSRRCWRLQGSPPPSTCSCSTRGGTRPSRPRPSTARTASARSARSSLTA